MKSITKNSSGFGLVPVLIVLVVVLVIAGAGWYVYQRNQSGDNEVANQTSSSSKQETNKIDETEKYTPPTGWVKYDDIESGLSFYYPGSWNKTDFEVLDYEIDQAISSGFGSPVSTVLNKRENKWERYLNYGTQYQKPVDEAESDPNDFALKQTDSKSTPYPVAYFSMGDGGAVTQLILSVKDERSYKIRLPLSYDPGCCERPAGEKVYLREDLKESVNEIIKSIKFE